MLQKLRGNSKGFTLIELMIVIAIIGILAAIAIPNFISYRDKAYCAKAETDAQNAIAAIASYFSEPENTSLDGGFATLADQEELILNDGNQATVDEITDGTGMFEVTISDGSLRCPRAKDPDNPATIWHYFAYMGTTERDATHGAGWRLPN
ncbi:MAG: prepilin-type N-terminal cleavage/methylation domain-containing protein [Desulfobacterales bacterium]